MSSLGTNRLVTATMMTNVKWFLEHKLHTWIVVAAHMLELLGEYFNNTCIFIVFTSE